MKVAVVTANIGAYDRVEHDHKLSSEIDYIYFTDGTEVPVGWQREELPPQPRLDPRRKAKLPKCFPHFLPVLYPYTHVVWIDAGMTLLDADAPFALLSHMKQSPLIVSPHFDDRNCLYEEAKIRSPAYVDQPLDEQVAWYRSYGLPENEGLYETGMLGWHLNLAEGAKLGAAWYIQNIIFSYQDQVSLPFVLWSQLVGPNVLPRSFRYMNWVSVGAHSGPSGGATG